MKAFLKKQFNLYTVVVMVSILSFIASYFGLHYVARYMDFYPDFLVGDNAYFGGNKSGEWKLMWSLIGFGIVITSILTWAISKFFMSPSVDLKKNQDTGMMQKALHALVAFLPMGIHLFIYGKTTVTMCLASVFVAFAMIVFGTKALDHIVLFLNEYFVIQVLMIVINLLNPLMGAVDYENFLYAAWVFVISEMCIYKRFASVSTLIRRSQMGLPFLFLVYLKNQYQYEGQIVQIPFPKRYVAMMIALVSVCLLYNLYQFFWRKKEGIYFTTVISVFAYVSYMTPAMIMQYDLHHHGEQLLPWHQIIELSQKAYETYYPASGFYPMLVGGINHFLFHGQCNLYAVSYVLFALLFEFVTMGLLCRLLDTRWCLCVAVLFHMPVYCRTWMILPVLLCLLQKKLLQNRLYWMLSSVALCLLSGLYYPIFGCATLLAILPVFLYQFAKWIQEKGYLQLKQAKYVLPTIVVGALVLALTALLFRMAKHVLTLSGQTLLVDGVPIMTADVQDWFMPYLSDEGLKNTIYHLVRFNLGIIILLFFVAILIRVLLSNVWKHLDETSWVSMGIMAFSIPMILLVAYTYTMVIMDEHWVSNLLSRSSHVILCVGGVVGFLLIYQFGHHFMTKNEQWWGCAIALSLPFFFFFQTEDYMFPVLASSTTLEDYVFLDYEGNVKPYEVPRQYVMITDEVRAQYPKVDFSRIGEGFVQTEVLEKTNQYQNILDFLRTYDDEIHILGFEQNQMYYYLLNEKTVYSGRTSIARSKEAVDEVLKHVDLQHTVVRGGVKPLEEYYLYHELIDAGYVFSEELQLYLPPGLYESIYGYSGDLTHSTWNADVFCYSEPYSFSTSYDFLVKTMDVSNPFQTGDEIRFEEVLGKDAEFLKLQLSSSGDIHKDAICYVTFYDDEETKQGPHSISFNYDQGDFMVPLGVFPSWYQSNHSRIYISIVDSDEILDTNAFSVKQIAFFDLNALP